MKLWHFATQRFPFRITKPFRSFVKRVVCPTQISVYSVFDAMILRPFWPTTHTDTDFCPTEMKLRPWTLVGLLYWWNAIGISFFCQYEQQLAPERAKTNFLINIQILAEFLSRPKGRGVRATMSRAHGLDYPISKCTVIVLLIVVVWDGSVHVYPANTNTNTNTNVLIFV